MEEYKSKLQNWTTKNGPPLRKEKNSPFAHFTAELKKQTGKDLKWKKIKKMWHEATDDLKQTLKSQLTCPDPVNSVSVIILIDKF